MNVEQAVARCTRYVNDPPARTPVGESAKLLRCLEDLCWGLEDRDLPVVAKHFGANMEVRHKYTFRVAMERILLSRRKRRLGDRWPTEGQADPRNWERLKAGDQQAGDNTPAA